MEALALLFASSWSAGLNAYLALLVVGLFGLSSGVNLPDSLVVLQKPWVLLTAGTMTVVE